MTEKQRKTLKTSRLIAMIGLTAALCLSPFLAVFLVGVNSESRYGETYYGELHEMYTNLKNTEEKKIVVLGNSNVAFGFDSKLAEDLLKKDGLDYKICNFGLYGSLGTKMMLDLSRNNINEGDIVIFTPEIGAAALCNYFSAEQAWYSLDSGMEMYKEFDSETKTELAANFPSYVSKKFALASKGEYASPSGVYAKSSFDERCDLKNYARPYNTMPNEVDVNVPISFDTSIYASDFIDYVNEYYRDIKARGAEMYYSYSPMNRKALTADATEKADALSDFIYDSFDFPLISDINDYILDSGWFFDTNYHLNESGMTLRTALLVNDLKNEFGITKKTEITLPEMPIAPTPGVTGEGDNTCAKCFTYSKDGNYYTVDGLTDEGMAKEDLIIPYQVDGLYVKAFNEDVFLNNENLKSVRIQKNISVIMDGSFTGCSNLEKIILDHTEPGTISVGANLKSGTNCKIYVPNDALSKFMGDYTWGKYAKDLCGY